MKKEVRYLFLAVILLSLTVSLFLLAGCGDGGVTSQDEPKAVTPVGSLPEAFEAIVQKNLFKDAVAFENRVLRAATSSTGGESGEVDHTVSMMDLYGALLADITVRTADTYSVTTLTATSDGGFLFVLGFRDRYLQQEQQWASEKSFASRVIKCDKEGTLQFDTAINRLEGGALHHCIEKNRQFYFFGTSQTPDTKTLGVHSPTDVHMTILDQNGSVIQSKTIGGSDYDSLDAAEAFGDGFVLAVSAQSDDGDFEGSRSKGYAVDWVICVNDDLKITEKKKQSGRESPDYRIGEKDGAPIYQSDPILKGFDAGMASAYLDYGEFYLIVSENVTGVCENTPPTISSIWYYTETVYSAYEPNGKLLFRAAIDSSPDYDSIVENFQG